MVTPVTGKLLTGVSYPSTISRCELMPMIQGLMYIAKYIVQPHRGAKIRIVSDSECTVKAIGGLYDPRKNAGLWAYYAKVAEGYDVTAVWRERNSHTGMEIADAAAYVTRSQFKEYMKKVAVIELPAYETLELDKL